MGRYLALSLLLAMGSSAFAEIIYCRFERGFQPSTFTLYNTVKKTLYVRHGWPQEENFYTNVTPARQPLPPYAGKKRATSLLIFDDIGALHFRRTNNGTLQSDSGRKFPYEAYMGRIPGRLKSNALDRLFGHDFGPRGVCWTKALPGEVHEGGGNDRGGDHGGHGDCGGGNHK